MDEKMKKKIESICEKYLSLTEQRIDEAMGKKLGEYDQSGIDDGIRVINHILQITAKINCPPQEEVGKQEFIF